MKNPPRLEPRSPAAAGPVDRDLIDLTRRFRIAVRLTVLVVIAALGDRIPGVPLAYIAPPRFWVWFQVALSLPIVLWSGAPFFRRGARAIARGRPDRFTLVALGVASTWIYSMVAALRPDLFPEPYRDELGNVRLHFEAATVIVTLALVGWLIERRALAGAAASIRERQALQPRTTRRLRPDGLEEDAALADVLPGDLVRVWPGETVPFDGVVVDGVSSVDESSITGDLTAVEKGPGVSIAAGATNRVAALVIRVESGADDTLLTRIVRVAGEAQHTRAPIQGSADRLAAVLPVAALVVALATFAVWATRGPEPRLELATLNAVAVLMVASPGAFSLAAAMPLAVAIARGARSGMVWHSYAAIQRLRAVDALVLGTSSPNPEERPRALRLIEAGAMTAEQKAEAVRCLKAEGRWVAVATDDARDAPALARADVGIAMGTGTDVAIESAGVTLVKGDLRGILRARRLSSATMRNIKQNLFFAFVYNSLGVPVAAGVLYPYFGLLLDPMIAAAAMSLSSVSVIGNALRLRLARI